jgi:L-fucose isomerase-like protein
MVAVQDVVAVPQDGDAQAALRLAVRKLLAADPQLLADVAQMVQQEAPRQRAGDRSVVIGGSQSGGTNVTGDSNRIRLGSQL